MYVCEYEYVCVCVCVRESMCVLLLLTGIFPFHELKSEERVVYVWLR